MTDAVGRTISALAGGVEAPPVCGVSFLDPALVPGAADAPERVLARAAADARLDFAFVPSWEPWAGRLLGLLHAAGLAVLWVGPGVLTPTLERVGHSAGLRATAADPGSLGPRLDAAADAARRAVTVGVGLHADAIVVADDLAGEVGPLVGFDFFADEVLPRIARAVAPAAEAGLPLVLHSDGDIAVFLHAVRGAGFASVHVAGVGEEAFERLHERARRAHLAVIGGLPARTLSRGRPAAVLQGTRLAILAQAGGLLLSDDGGMTTADEYAAFLEALGAARREDVEA